MDPFGEKDHPSKDPNVSKTPWRGACSVHHRAWRCFALGHVSVACTRVGPPSSGMTLLRPRMLGLVLILVASGVAIGAGCTVQSNTTSDAATDSPSDTDSALDAAPVDTCAVSTRSPAANRECSAANPCPAELDCLYVDGCENPKAYCRPWARCNDSGIAPDIVCGCDGVERRERAFPYISAHSPAGSGACPKDASPD